MGTKSTQLSGWGQRPACLKEGHTLFLSSRENWKTTGWTCRTVVFGGQSETSPHNSPHGSTKKKEMKSEKQKQLHRRIKTNMDFSGKNVITIFYLVKVKYFHKKQICLFLFSDIHLRFILYDMSGRMEVCLIIILFFYYFAALAPQIHTNW